MKPLGLAHLYLLAIGLPVAHQGASIGKIKEVRRNVPNGRAYALVQPIERGADTRRLPLDELEEATS